MKTTPTLLLACLFAGGEAVAGVGVEKNAARIVKSLDTGGEVVVRGNSAYAFDTGRYEFAPDARAFLLGSAYGALEGRFVGPYFVKAKLKRTEGDFDLLLKIRTRVQYLDSAGKKLADARNAPRGSRIEEEVTGWSMGVLNGAGEWRPPLPAAAPAGDAVALVKNSAAVRAEAEELKLRRRGFGILTATRMNPYGAYERGRVSVWSDRQGVVRRVRFVDFFDHSKKQRLTHDVYFDATGNPRLCVETLESGPDGTERRGAGYRKTWQLTLSANANGAVGRVTMKSYYHTEDQHGRETIEKPLDNKQIHPGAETLKHYIACARGLHRADAPTTLALADTMQRTTLSLAGK